MLASFTIPAAKPSNGIQIFQLPVICQVGRQFEIIMAVDGPNGIEEAPEFVHVSPTSSNIMVRNDAFFLTGQQEAVSIRWVPTAKGTTQSPLKRPTVLKCCATRRLEMQLASLA